MIQYTADGVTVTLSGSLEARFEALAEEVVGAIGAQLHREAQVIAARARAEWYGPDGVRRETGKSGDIVARTIVDEKRGLIRVTVGSTDDRTGKNARGQVAPVPVFIKAAGLPVERVEVSKEEYFRTPGPRRHWDRSTGRWYIDRVRQRVSKYAGRGLLEVLVKKPMRDLAKRLGSFTLNERVAA